MKGLHLHILLVSAILLVAIGCNKDPNDQEPPEETIEIPVDQRGVVYTSNASSKFEIWKLEGEASTQLTKMGEADAWWARYSIASDQVLFYSSKGSRDINDYTSADLNVMDINGGDLHTIISSGDHGWNQQGLANWSHDGNSIVLSAQEGTSTTWQIYTTNKEGNDPQRISLRDDVDYLDPIFDTDDDAIICVTVPEGVANKEENYEVVRVYLEDGREERLTNNGRRDQHPALSNDGSHIVYESLVDPDYLSIGKWSIMEVDLSAGSETTVLDNDDINLFPRYSFDGTAVLYTRLNIESFAMKIGRVEIASGETSVMVSEEGHSMNADPY